MQYLILSLGLEKNLPQVLELPPCVFLVHCLGILAALSSSKILNSISSTQGDCLALPKFLFSVPQPGTLSRCQTEALEGLILFASLLLRDYYLLSNMGKALIHIVCLVLCFCFLAV